MATRRCVWPVVLEPEPEPMEEVGDECGQIGRACLHVRLRGRKGPLPTPVHKTRWKEEDFDSEPYVINLTTLDDIWHDELDTYAGTCPRDAMRCIWTVKRGDIVESDVHSAPRLFSRDLVNWRGIVAPIARNGGFEGTPFGDAIMRMMNETTILGTDDKYGKLYSDVIFLSDINSTVAALNRLTPGAAFEGFPSDTIHANEQAPFSPNDAPLLHNIERYMSLDDESRLSYIDHLVGIREITHTDHHVKRVVHDLDPRGHAYTAMAKRLIQVGRFIGEYTGVWTLPARRGAPSKKSDYSHGFNMYFGDPATANATAGYVLDAANSGNQLRFINSSGGYKKKPARGAAPGEQEPADPNVDFVQYWYNGEPHIGVIAVANIPAGTEFIASYGGDYWYDVAHERYKALLEKNAQFDQMMERHKREVSRLKAREPSEAAAATVSPVGLEAYRLLTLQLNKEREIVAQLRSDVEERNMVVAALEERKEQSDITMANQRTELEKISAAHQAALDVAKSFSGKFNELNATHNRLLDAIRQQQAKAAAARETPDPKDDLQVQLEQQQQIQKHLQDQLAAAEQARDKAVTDLAEVSRQAQSDSASLTTAQAELTELRTQLRASKTELEQAETRASLAEGRADSAAAAARVVETIEADYIAKARQYDAYIADLTAAKTQLADENATLREESIAAVQQYTAMIAELRARGDQLANENAQLRAVPAPTETVPLDAHRATVDAHAAQVGELQATIANLQQQLATVQQEMYAFATRDLERRVQNELQGIRGQLLQIRISVADVGAPEMMTDVTSLSARVEKLSASVNMLLTTVPSVTERVGAQTDDKLGKMCVQCGAKTQTMCNCGCKKPYCSKECLKKALPHDKSG